MCAFLLRFAVFIYGIVDICGI